MSKLIEGLESIKVLFDTKAKQSENAGYWKDFAGIIADAISTITEKTQRIENMETMIEDMEERIAIMSEGGWRDVKTDPPKWDCDCIVCAEGESQFSCARFDKEGMLVFYDPDIYESYAIRGVITHWMPLPEPPKEGEA